MVRKTHSQILSHFGQIFNEFLFIFESVVVITANKVMKTGKR